MKNTFLTLIFIFYVSFAHLFAQSSSPFDYKWPVSDGLMLINKGGSPGFDEGIYGGKWGYADSTGKIIIPLVYDNAHSFHNGIAIVSQNNKFGIIDKTGKFIIQPKFDMIQRYVGDLAPANLGLKYTSAGGHDVLEENGKWGFIDKKGQIIIPIQYDSVEDFSEGLAAVKLNGLWGYIDITGKIIIPIKYQFAGSFSNGKASVSMGLDSRSYFIDKTGNEIK